MSGASVFRSTLGNGPLLRLELAFAAFNGAEWAVVSGHASAKSAAASVIARRRDELLAAESAPAGSVGVERGMP